MGKLLGGRYRVLSPLGEGGMGTVYLCEHAVLHRRLAVKVLRPDLASDPELVDRFRNEAVAASRIGQENVVDVLDFGTSEDGSLYYVMEALDGRSLGAVIRQDGPFSVGRTLDLLEQICRALAAAHSSGVVHRDVKPDNVLLVRREDGSELAKVIDFGISHNRRQAGAAPITRSGAIIGTPEYMAPEQAAGDPVDRRTDVYAVGVLAFEMLTGELPIAAATPIATLVAHQTRTPDPPSRRRPSVPAEVDALVLRALAKRPEDRFASMEALAAEVARVRATFSRTVSYSPRPSGPRGETMALPETRDDVRRATLRVKRTTRVALVLGVAVAIAAVVGWLALTRMHAAEAAPSASASPPAPAATQTSLSAAAPAAGGAIVPTEARDGGEAAERARGGAGRVIVPAAAATPLPTPDAAARAPSLFQDRAAAAPEAPVPVAEPPAHRRAARRPEPVRGEEAEQEDDLKDPYSSGGDLKDPFK
ncbi:MAG TPA: serine/threonine-protein kinase [Anaeromyxobacter sp.]